MHLFSHSETRPHDRMVRAHAYFDLPDNPICWLLGHRARVEVKRWRATEPWVLVECRICGRRHQQQKDTRFDLSSLLFRHRARDGEPERLWTDRELRELQTAEAKEWAARRVEYAERDPAGLARACSGKEEQYSGAKLELNAELHWRGLKKGLRRLKDNAGVRLHTGGRGSETPYDAHLDLGVGAAYLSIGGVGGRWAQFIGRGHGRDLALSLHGGHVWWKLWYDGDSGNDEHHRCDKWRQPPFPWSLGRRKYRGWLCSRDGSLEVNPLDAWFGSPLYHYDKSEPWRETVVDIGQFPGDHYLVKFRREPYVRHRDHGPRFARRVLERGVGVEFDAVIRSPELQPGQRSEQPGIPYRNHDWKGDEVCSGGVRPPDGGWPAGDEWLPAAVQALTDSILRDRVRYQYRPPKVDA